MFKTFLFFISIALTLANPIVKTPLGKIQGEHRQTQKLKIYSSFEGIPYAKPPIEDRRFEPPEPVEPWSGVWDASSVTECPQTKIMKFDVINGEEDCLYLNIYVPRSKPGIDDNLDVIVHIHGGLFQYGSGHAYSHPEYFMEKDVIFISFNYRLGIFGFLSTADGVVSGNNGLKDQVMALKWIQNNIANFGGNPNSVTLTGLSAGASSVHYHYLSEMSQGLFHKGLSQSGVALNTFALQEEPLKKAKMLAEAVGCPQKSTSSLVKCLKQRPMRLILSKMNIFFDYQFLPTSPFAPVLEKSNNAFISKNPYYLLAKKQLQDIPWLVSTVSHEGLFPAAVIFRDLTKIDEEWSRLAPFILDYRDSLAEPLWSRVADKLLERYFGGDGEINTETYWNFVQMLSDRFLADVDSAIKLQAKANKSPVYYYQFSYPSETNKNKTVGHTEDAQYFFYNIYGKKLGDNDLKMKDLLMDMLVEFAKTGVPKIGDSEWPPVEYPDITFLNVNSTDSGSIKVGSIKELAPKDFWKALGFLENQNLMLIKDEL